MERCNACKLDAVHALLASLMLARLAVLLEPADCRDGARLALVAPPPAAAREAEIVCGYTGGHCGGGL